MSLPTYAASLISSVAKVQQNADFPQYVLGGRNQSSYKLFKKADSYGTVISVWRSPVYRIGKNFDVLKIKFAIKPAVAANITITPVLYFDHEATSSVGTTINSTNYTNAERLIKLNSKNFANGVRGRNNFFLELQFSGSALAVVKLPIEIELEVMET